MRRAACLGSSTRWPGASPTGRSSTWRPSALALRYVGSREDLRALIENSTFEIPTTEHRRLHQEASDFVRWGRRGGRRTLALYGRPYFSLLARLRWGRAPLEALTRHRAGSL